MSSSHKFSSFLSIYLPSFFSFFFLILSWRLAAQEADMSSSHSQVHFFSFSIHAFFLFLSSSFFFFLLLSSSSSFFFFFLFFFNTELDLVGVGGLICCLCVHVFILCFLRKDSRDKAVQDEEAERRRQVRK